MNKPKKKEWENTFDTHGFNLKKGFLTNGRGVAFRIHSGTKTEELRKLVQYIDKLEDKINSLPSEEEIADIIKKHYCCNDDNSFAQSLAKAIYKEIIK